VIGRHTMLELDAMDPNDLRACVKCEIKKLIEPVAWRRCEVVNRAEQESLRTILSQWASPDDSGNGYKLMCVHKDITASKLSALQKRILVHAHKAMLAKEQKIAAPTRVTVCIPAPPWLSEVLSKAMAQIAKARQGYMLDSDLLLTALHPWMRPFAEMTFLGEQIKAAAKEAGVQDREINLTRLYVLACPLNSLST